MQFINRRDLHRRRSATLILPRSLSARTPDRFFFIHADSLNFWPVTDPVAWSLEHSREPILQACRRGPAEAVGERWR